MLQQITGSTHPCGLHYILDRIAALSGCMRDEYVHVDECFPDAIHTNATDPGAL